MNFWKMNGAGNDFIIIDNREKKLPEGQLPQLIRTICERHLSLGADGVMLVEKPEEKTSQMAVELLMKLPSVAR